MFVTKFPKRIVMSPHANNSMDASTRFVASRSTQQFVHAKM